MKYKKGLLVGLIFSNTFFCIGQQSAPYESVSIYEFGAPVTNCDINMKNLISNWVPEKVANANEYEFLEWSFVETIKDSSCYIHYRNYFSSNEPVYNSQKRKGGYSNGNEYDSLWIYPGFIHLELYDIRGLPDKAKVILSEDVRQKAKDIFLNDFNIDTIALLYHSYHKTDSTERFETTGGYNVSGKSIRHVSHDIASIDSLSQNYFDVVMTNKKSYDDLSIEETRELLLEQLSIERINKQLNFNHRVELGDKVFLIKFAHKEGMHHKKVYNNYIICSSETNKVVMDYFFEGINFKKYKYDE